MKKPQTAYKRLLLAVCIASVLAIALSFSVQAGYINASIVRVDNNVTQNVYYYDKGGGYKDNVGITPDTKLRVCADLAADLAGKAAAAFYVMAPNNATIFIYDILGGDTVARYVSFGAPFAYAGKFCADANFEFYAGRSPYPAKIFVGIDEDGDDGEIIDANDTVVAVPSTNGYLPYGYSRNDVQSTYNPATGNVTIDATATNPLVSQTASTKLLVGSCTDDQGANCSGAVRTSVDAGGVSVFTGIIGPSDSVNFTRYSVINGFGVPYCIGPDADVSYVSVVPSVAPKGTIVNLSAFVTNTNTVDITTNFDVQMFVGATNLCNVTLTAPLAAGASKYTSTCLWNTTGIPSGTTTIIGHPLDVEAGIADCDDGNDNGTGTFSTELVYIPKVWIDGVETNIFPDAGEPYNLTVYMVDSDGLTPPVELRLTEENGMSIFSPTQLYTLNTGKSGVIAKSTSVVTTDNTGYITFAVVPTGTKLYEPEYSYLNLSSYVGNHSIYFKIYNITTGAELQMYFNNSKQSNFSFVLVNMTPRSPNATEENSKTVINQNLLVKEALDLAYRSLATAVRWLK
ncbi:Uncharacterised protein [uncultured archaeon]|nr:Uncharacterised protein [uncultured archaeon]